VIRLQQRERGHCDDRPERHEDDDRRKSARP
jgi:hypothetical protein